MYKKRENVYVVSQFQAELSFVTGKARRSGLIVWWVSDGTPHNMAGPVSRELTKTSQGYSPSKGSLLVTYFLRKPHLFVFSTLSEQHYQTRVKHLNTGTCGGQFTYKRHLVFSICEHHSYENLNGNSPVWAVTAFWTHKKCSLILKGCHSEIIFILHMYLFGGDVFEGGRDRGRDSSEEEIAFRRKKKTFFLLFIVSRMQTGPDSSPITICEL